MTVVHTENKPSLVEGVHDLEERLRDSRDQLYAMNSQAIRVIQDHPAACIAGAFVVGWFIGKLAQKRWLV